MVVTELIKLLENAKEEYGDAEIYYHDNEFGPEEITQIRNDDKGYIPNNGLLIE